MTILQLALDLADLERALKIAEEAAPYVDWLEAGTPLIKSEGLNAVRELRKRFPRKTIVADMKIADTGAFEVELAAKAGADVVTVMAVVDDSTVREAVKAGERFNAKVMADMIGVPDVPKRLCELKKLGVHYACLHIGIDQQMRGVKIVEEVRKFKCDIPFAVAGGVSVETVAEVAASGAEIVIVGGAITKAAKPAEAAKAIHSALPSKKKVKVTAANATAADSDSVIRKIFLQVSTPNIADAMQRTGAMTRISPILQGAKMAGRAVTVRT